VLSPGRNCLYSKRRDEVKIQVFCLGLKLKACTVCLVIHICFFWDKLILKKVFWIWKIPLHATVCRPQSVYTHAYPCETCFLLCVFLYIKIMISVISSLKEKAGQRVRMYLSLPVPFSSLVYALTWICHYLCDGKRCVGKNSGRTCWIWWCVVATITV
jgi:hypothetical protein